MTIRKTVSIRKETPQDYASICIVNDAAFGQKNESTLVELLRKSSVYIPGLSLVAELEGQIIGHILFTKLTIIEKESIFHRSISLAPMSVLPEYQNFGVGSELVKKGLENVKAMGYESVIVLGHAEYYPRFGFQPASKWKITCPYEVPDDVFMALELVPGALTNISGIAEYPEEFNEAM